MAKRRKTNGATTEETMYQVIERGRTTGWIYGVTKPLSFHVAENFAFLLRSISKQGGHEVSCYFVQPFDASLESDRQAHGV
jgi:hypothetical protein